MHKQSSSGYKRMLDNDRLPPAIGSLEFNQNSFVVPEVQLLSEVELLNPKVLTNEPLEILDTQ
ncbi:MAG: hypothetical protein R3C62_18015 [Chloroflexota bacterium]